MYAEVKILGSPKTKIMFVEQGEDLSSLYPNIEIIRYLNSADVVDTPFSESHPIEEICTSPTQNYYVPLTEDKREPDLSYTHFFTRRSVKYGVTHKTLYYVPRRPSARWIQLHRASGCTLAASFRLWARHEYQRGRCVRWYDHRYFNKQGPKLATPDFDAIPNGIFYKKQQDTISCNNFHSEKPQKVVVVKVSEPDTFYEDLRDYGLQQGEEPSIVTSVTKVVKRCLVTPLRVLKKVASLATSGSKIQFIKEDIASSFIESVKVDDHKTSLAGYVDSEKVEVNKYSKQSKVYRKTTYEPFDCTFEKSRFRKFLNSLFSCVYKKQGLFDLNSIKEFKLGTDNTVDKVQSIVDQVSLMINSGEGKLDQMQGIADKFDSVTNGSTNSLDKLDELVSKIQATGFDISEDTKNFVTDAINEIKTTGIKVNMEHKVGSSIKIHATEIALAILVCIGLILFSPSIYVSGAIILFGLLCGGCITKLINWVNSNKQEIKDLSILGSFGFKKQSLDYKQFLAPCSRLIATGIVSLTSATDSRSLPSYVKAQQVASSFNSITTMGEGLSKSIDLAHQFLWESQTGLPYVFKDGGDLVCEITEWLALVDITLRSPDWIASLPTSNENMEQLEEINLIGVDLMQRIQHASPDLKMKKFEINEALSLVKQTVKSVQTLKGPKIYRPVPVFVCMKGSTGLGKTHMVERLSVDLFDKLSRDEQIKFKEPKDLIFASAPKSEFNDGYRNQLVFFRDEVFQSKLPEVQDQDIGSILSIVSPGSQPANVAVAEFKNSIVINSYYYIATTNLENWDLLPMVHLPAIKGRMDFVIRPVTKKEFREAYTSENKQCYRLDFVKWMQYCEENDLDSTKPDHSMYHSYDRFTEKFIESLTYDELVAKIHQKHEVKLKVMETTKSNLGKLMEKYRKQGGVMGQISALKEKISQSVSEGLYHHLNENASFSPICLLPLYFTDYQVKTEFETLHASTQCPVKAVESWSSTSITDEDLEKIELFKSIVKEWKSLTRETQMKIYVAISYALKAPLVSRSYLINVFHKFESLKKLKPLDIKINNYTVILQAHALPVHSFKNRFYAWLKHAKDNFPYGPIFGVLGCISAVLLLALGATQLYKNLQPNLPVRPKLNPNSKFESRQEKSRKAKNVKFVRKSTQMESDENVQEIISTEDLTDVYSKQALQDSNWESQFDLVHKNLYSASVYNAMGVRLSTTKALAIFNNHILVPSHLLNNSTDACTIKLSGLVEKEFKLSNIKQNQIGERWYYDDLTMLTVKNFPCKSILNLFATEKEITSLSDCYGELILVRDGKVMRAASHITADTHNQNTMVDSDLGLKAVVGWHYIMPTINGDCGSPLVRWDPSTNGKIIGIHAAATGNFLNPAVGSYACIVDRDWLETFVSNNVKQSDVNCTFTPPNYVSRGMVVIDSVDQDKQISLPMKSRIRPSRLSRVLNWQSASKPANLNMDSLTLACTKYPFKSMLMDEKLIGALSLHYYYKHFFCADKSYKDVYTINESLNKMLEIDSINFKSSLGLPWVLDSMKKNNFIRFNEDIGFTIKENTEFSKILEEFPNLIRSGHPPEILWSTTLKDERLPTSKVDQNKVRIFTASPFHFTVLCRQYFSGFMSYLKTFSFTKGIAVGIDAHTQWSSLADWLLHRSSKFLAADYSNWDKTLPTELMNIFFDWADLHYGSKDKDIRDYVRQNIISPTFQLQNFKYKTLCGNPSGCAFTAEINSVSNIILTQYIIMKVTNDFEYAKNVIPMTYGDDIIIPFDREIDLILYKKELAKIGIGITPASKVGELELQDLDEISFLCRKFVKYQNNYLAPLPLSTIKDSVLWVSSKFNEFEIERDTLRNAILEFKQHRNIGLIYIQLLEATRKLNIDLDVTEEMIADVVKIESYSNSVAQALLLNLLGSIWNQSLKYDKPLLEPKYKKKHLKVQYVGLDLGKKVPLIPKNIFYHVGFRIDDVEICFSDRGLVQVKQSYEPDFEFTVEIDMHRGVELAEGVSYQRVNRNCIWWAETLMGQGNLHKNLMEWSRLNQSWLMQADDGEPSNVIEDTISKSVQGYISEPAVTRTVKEIVYTPEIIRNGSWDGSAPNTEVASIDIPNDLLVIPQIGDKIRYNTLLKADVEFELRVATNQFQQGVLAMVWIPQANQGYPAGQPYDIYALTAAPHVRFYASEGNVTKLKIKYVHEQFALSLVNKRAIDSMGTLKIIILNTLKSGITTESVSYRVLVHLSNVEIQYPTPLGLDRNKWVSTDLGFGPIYRAQGEAEEKSSVGFLSGVAESVTNIATLVGKIPIFSGPMAMVSTISTSVGTIARALGLSKPRSLETTRPVIPRPFTNVCHRDGLDMSIPLSNDPKNSIKIIPSVFATNIDELNLSYIVSTPMCIGTINWTMLQEQGEILLSLPVIPTLSGLTHKNSGDLYQLTPMGYVANAFKYWRGSINFEFEVICTSFHKGTIVATFVPFGAHPSEDGKTELYLTTTEHKIFDLAESHRFTLKADYISPRPYQHVSRLDKVSLTDLEAIGTINLVIFNTLKAPGIGLATTVANSVDINIWISGGNDMKFAFPTIKNIQLLGYGPEVTKEEDDWVIQGNIDIQENMPSREQHQFGKDFPSFKNFSSHDDNYIDYVMGETVENLRDLLKVFCLKVETIQQSGKDTFTVPMHSFSSNKLSKIDKDTFYDYFMRLYRFSRGSLRYKIITSSVDSNVVAVLRNEKLKPWIWYQKATSDIGNPWAICVPKLNPTLEVAIPFYHHNKLVVHGSQQVDRNMDIEIKNYNNELIQLDIYEAIGDDFSAGYLFAPPKLWYIPTLDLKLITLLNVRTNDPVTGVTWRDVSHYKGSPHLEFNDGVIPIVLSKSLSIDTKNAKLFYSRATITNKDEKYIKVGILAAPTLEYVTFDLLIMESRTKGDQSDDGFYQPLDVALHDFGLLYTTEKNNQYVEVYMLKDGKDYNQISVLPANVSYLTSLGTLFTSSGLSGYGSFSP